MTADRPPLAEGIPDRLYGRRRGHPLRPRQQRLLEETLPRLRLSPAQAADPRAAFGRPVEAVWLEVGFGGGEHALAHVEAHPEVGYIASEVFENGLCSLLSRLVEDGAEADGPLPPHLRLWPQDARHLLGLLPEGSLDRLFLMFPDPWPKARHAKRRFVNPALLPLVARVLRPGGEWRIASDDPTYQAWVAEVMAAQDVFEVPEPATSRPASWPGTRYEAKALREGRQPLYWSLKRL
ncbi:tRNA (guanosine(46)-N7)-methyltransferase TrmB [Belnapia sp. T6]|uniref:tRNA (guanine-N(7)-)-methyltransferase n=1 Tax=Belnapia mucosa TaxID=2804532 RepID=A0ABS1V475_9PROT|nr:tRNA (guanine(46)-N(7))-methyltransferase TrmB [Belnapia mucosa]MBL6456485.1 tRNA (guanosine(46)-N7)-methyltransferase TrmB [Belnapia mucosa]